MKTLTIDIEEINIEEIDSLYSKLQNDKEIRCIVFECERVRELNLIEIGLSYEEEEEKDILHEKNNRKINKVIPRFIPNTITHLSFNDEIHLDERAYNYFPQSILKIKDEYKHIITRDDIKEILKQFLHLRYEVL